MNHLSKRLKRKVLKKTAQINDAVNSIVLPFKEMPSNNNIVRESDDRINAHELFSLYTGNLIKQDIVYAR